MSFWETCFGSNKSLRAAVECNPVLWNHLVLVEPTFFGGFQADIPHYLFRHALRAHPLLENAGYKTEGWGGTEAWMLPSCPLPPTSPVSPSMPLFEEEEREVIPTFASAYDFFFFLFSPLVTEEACYQSEQTSGWGTLQSSIPAEGGICCGLSLVRSLVWSWFCSFVLSRTEDGLITVDIFEGSLQFDRITAIRFLEQTEFI